MRLQQLRLLAYGKFTDRVLDFAPAAMDFHLVIGHNEAGKSTTRQAILDLLYGIELRSSLDFVHAKPQMRLGAVLQQPGRTLDLVRSKGRLNTLRDAHGEVLPDSVLLPFLAGTDRTGFDQMFGLDHGRLQAGGQAILNNASDIGQLLFQSASGMAGLGAVREQLRAEADMLWAPKAAGHRAWYRAKDELDEAKAALKSATVRTAEWLAAQQAVQAQQQRGQQAQQRWQTLHAERIRLERARRVAPSLRALAEREAELAGLQQVLPLPADAAQRLADVELALASAGRDQQLHQAQAQRALQALAGLAPDAALLAQAAAVQSLASRAQQLAGHEAQINRAQTQAQGLWQQLQALQRQLPGALAAAADEAALRQALPAPPQRAALASLAQRFALLAQVGQSSAQALDEQASQLNLLEQQALQGSVRPVPAALRAAVAGARALGDLASEGRRHQSVLRRSQQAQEQAQADLQLLSATDEVASAQPFQPDLVRLGAWPGPAEVAAAQQALADALARLATLAQHQQALADSVAAQELGIRQIRQAHHPVSHDELAAARGARDALWLRIKTGEPELPALAPVFEQSLQQADALADQRHDKAAELATLQSSQDQLQRLQLQQARLAQGLQSLQQDIGQQQQGWAHRLQRLALPALPLARFEAWRAACSAWHQAHGQQQEAVAQSELAQGQARAAAWALSAALAEAGTLVEAGGDVDRLLLQASDVLEAAAAAQASQQALQRELDSARSSTGRLQQRAAAAQAERQDWARQWQQMLHGTGLTGLLAIGRSDADGQTPPADDVQVAAVQAALGVMADIGQGLSALAELRDGRIAGWQQELASFASALRALCQPVDPALCAEVAVAPLATAATLAGRLLQAQQQQLRVDQLQAEYQAQEAQALAAAGRVAQAAAALQPLLVAARVQVLAELRPLIEQSDRRRAAEQAAATARAALEEAGDGLSVAALQAELAAVDATQVPVLIEQIQTAIEAERTQQDQITRELTQASAALAAIAGQSEAALAEARRQRALAAMAAAAERYLKVHTAQRLLKWAIDRYRDTRQGPMLGRASAIFQSLTLGSFSRLVIDADAEPPTLLGQRQDGTLVAIAGMSEGTRDQLYLALRLAALALHLAVPPADEARPGASAARQPGHAMPFIADDLFINYDEQRARAGLQALAELSRHTQVIFLSHHEHLLPAAQAVFGAGLSVQRL